MRLTDVSIRLEVSKQVQKRNYKKITKEKIKIKGLKTLQDAMKGKDINTDYYKG